MKVSKSINFLSSYATKITRRCGIKIIYTNASWWHIILRCATTTAVAPPICTDEYPSLISSVSARIKTLPYTLWWWWSSYNWLLGPRQVTQTIIFKMFSSHVHEATDQDLQLPKDARAPKLRNFLRTDFIWRCSCAQWPCKDRVSRTNNVMIVFRSQVWNRASQIWTNKEGKRPGIYFLGRLWFRFDFNWCSSFKHKMSISLARIRRVLNNFSRLPIVSCRDEHGFKFQSRT